jgi:hypothetical protein
MGKSGMRNIVKQTTTKRDVLPDVGEYFFLNILSIIHLLITSSSKILSRFVFDLPEITIPVTAMLPFRLGGSAVADGMTKLSKYKYEIYLNQKSIFS